WSYQDSNLHEYAHREWSGLLSDFYKPRWELFFHYLQQKIEGKGVEAPDFYVFEKAWTKQTNSFPTKPIYTPLEQSIKMYNKYYKAIQQCCK
ncbi:MAG: alpha-N-acetylglucosaminidase, partial [Bacteroidia bacterium]